MMPMVGKHDLCDWNLGMSERRKFLGLTQEGLAKLVGVSREHLGRIEGGKVEASPEMRRDIDRELKVQAVLRYCGKTNCSDCKNMEEAGRTPHMQITDIKEKRLVYGVSRAEVIKGTLISEADLSALERSEHISGGEEWVQEIDDFLYVHRPRCPKEILIDYVNIRFPHTVKYADGDGDEHGCVKDIWESVLGIQMNDDFMFREERNYHNYTVVYQFWELTLRFSPKSNSGVLLEMRGQGCRAFEAILQSQNRSWYDFFERCLEKNGHITRLDIAVDDTIGLLSIPELIEKRKKGWVDFGRVQAVDCHESTLPDRLLEEAGEGISDMGCTMSIGSRKSPIRFCLYEKEYEQAKKHGIPLGELLGVKNRVEIRLRDDRAQNALCHLVASRDVGALAFGILNERLQFFTVDHNGEVWDCPKWRRFAGLDWAEVELTTKPEPYTDERSWRWFRIQCAPTVKYHLMRDVIHGTNFVNATVPAAVLSKRHEALLKQTGLDYSDIVVPELYLDEVEGRERKGQCL